MHKGLNIAFFGSSLLSAYWNGAATYYRGIIRALYQKGHRVTFFEPDAYGRQDHRDMDPPLWARVVVYPATELGVMQELNRARSADLIIKASGVGVFDEVLESGVLELRRPNNVVAFWDVDAPATLERVQMNGKDPFREKIPRFDLILTYGGGGAVVQGYRELGARECVPIYNGLDPLTHYPVCRSARFSCDLAFLGNRLPDREERVEEYFLGPAELLPKKRFLLGGSGWADKSLPGNMRYLGHVYTADHNALNASATTVLNIARSSMARFGFSPATRVFEAAGAAACVLSDEWEGIEQFFEPGKEMLVARSGTEVAETLCGLEQEKAARIGKAAYRRALSEHTYSHRAQKLEKALEGIVGNKVP